MTMLSKLINYYRPQTLPEDAQKDFGPNDKIFLSWEKNFLPWSKNDSYHFTNGKNFCPLTPTTPKELHHRAVI